jgi:Tol biopolymer transport system component
MSFGRRFAQLNGVIDHNHPVSIRNAVGAITIAALLIGCGDDGGRASSGSPPSTSRPELAFFTTHSDRNGEGYGEALYDIGVADDDGNGFRALTGESVAGTIVPNLFTSVSWDPDGSRLAFGGGTGEQQGGVDDESDIYLVDADGSGLERVTELDDAGDPLFSPDGETIVFSRVSFDGGEAPRAALWSVRADGSGLAQLKDAKPWRIDGAGSFSPDGEAIAFTRSELDPESFDATTSIQIVGADGSDERQLIGRGSDPAFSPDGERIAFVSDRDENGRLCYGDRCFIARELYVAAADGGKPERLTQTKELNEASPSWLPDGSRIAFQRGEQFQNAESMSILEMNADGSCTREILASADPGPWYAGPAWRPSNPSDGGGGLNC